MKNSKLNLSKLLVEFLKDKACSSLIYVLGCCVIILFYQISTKHKLEVAYPIALAVGIYLIYLVCSFILYAITVKKFSRMLYHRASIDEFYHERDKRIAQIMNQIHHDYTSQMMGMKEEKQSELNMISAWVHGMKTPVTVTDLILQRVRNHEMSLNDVVPELLDENKKILDLLDNILNMIRLQEFEKDYLPEAIDLGAELRSLINDNKSLFIQSRVFPKFEAPKDPIVILADTKWNRIMLQQIISNAVKYSRVDKENDEAKYVEFGYKCSTTSSGTRLDFTIQDHGIGIPECDRSRVFDLFFTGENGRKVEQSSGIGLYFAREICKMFGAQIFVDSNLGQGTTVTIRYLTKS